MKLSQFILEQSNYSKFISFTGGGGKTSLIICLSEYLKKLEKTVLITTTTKIQNPEYFDWKADFFTTKEGELNRSKLQVCVFGKEYKDISKWQSPSTEEIERVSKKFDIVLCEADGSNHKPIKLHTDRDPVIHPLSSYTISVMGIWGVGSKISDSVFGDNSSGIVDRNYLNSYVNNQEGLLKGSVNLVVINSSNCAAKEQIEIVKELSWKENVKVVLADIREDNLVEIIR